MLKSEKVKAQDAVGLTLCHDLTGIKPGEYKGRIFKKGHVIKENDIETLLDIGKKHVYVFSQTDGFVHENDSAIYIKNATAGKNLRFSDIKEGKINFIANKKGILKINKDLLFKLNMIENISFSTIRDNVLVNEGDIVAGTRIIPLYIKEDNLYEVEKICKSNKIIWVEEIKNKNISLISTGSEIFHGRIKDKSREVISNKLKNYNSSLVHHDIVDDILEDIKSNIELQIQNGSNIILLTGGMSVDPDDLTPSAIRESCDEVVTYGSPVLPGSMLMVGYAKNNVLIIGLPAAVIHSEKTVFDLILPKIMIDEKLTKEYIAELGFGGLLK